MRKEKNTLVLLSIILFFALFMLFAGNQSGFGITGAFLYPEVALEFVVVIVLMLLIVERGIKKK